MYKSQCIVFTYPPHYNSQWQTRTGIDEFWCLEPTHFADFEAKEGIVPISTSFPRKGNLNGLPFCHGMLLLMKELCDQGFDVIVKKDSDTLVHTWQHFNWLDSDEPRFVGQDGRRSWTWGQCYQLNKAMVYGLCKLAEEQPTLQFKEIGETQPEDGWMFFASSMVGKVLKLEKAWATPTRGWVNPKQLFFNTMNCLYPTSTYTQWRGRAYAHPKYLESPQPIG